MSMFSAKLPFGENSLGENSSHDLFDTIRAYLSTPSLTEPTRTTNQYKTLIGNVFVSKPYSNVASFFTCTVSDNF